jgi:hypothetical protein
MMFGMIVRLSLSVSCHEIGVGRRKELYLAHILGHSPFVVVNA